MARHLLFKAKMDILFDGKLDEYSSSKKSSFLFSVVNDSQLFCPGDWIGQGKKVGCDRQANSSRNVNRGAKSSTSFSGIIFSYFGTGFELRLNASNQFDSDWLHHKNLLDAASKTFSFWRSDKKNISDSNRTRTEANVTWNGSQGGVFFG